MVAIRQIIGVRPKYFRPPFGDIDNRIRGIALAMGLIPVMWSYDTSDWTMNTSLPRLDAFLKTKRPGAPGTITLEHDLDISAQFALPVLNVFKNNSINPMPVGSCVGDANWYNGIPILKKSPASGTTKGSSPTDISQNSQSGVAGATSFGSFIAGLIALIVY